MTWFLLISLISCENPTPKVSPEIPKELDYISLSNLEQEFSELGYPSSQRLPNGIIAPITTEFGSWKLSIQHFNEQQLLYLAVNDYLWIDQAETAEETVFTLTQLATRNPALVGAKLQLNPQNGAITISAEIPTGNGIETETVQAVLERLLRLAKEEYPMLKASLGINRY